MQQGTAGLHLAYFFGRAAHVDVDKLCALCHVVAGGFGHLSRVAAGNLHGNHAAFAAAVDAVEGFARVLQIGVAADHLAHRPAGAELPRQHAERFVGDAGHRRERHGGRNSVGADLHKAELL